MGSEVKFGALKSGRYRLQPRYRLFGLIKSVTIDNGDVQSSSHWRPMIPMFRQPSRGMLTGVAQSRPNECESIDDIHAPPAGAGAGGMVTPAFRGETHHRDRYGKAVSANRPAANLAVAPNK
jgi:hypothetical protein